MSTPTATCPKCNGKMSVTETVCPHCGYDFPLLGYPNATRSPEKNGIAYTALGDFALVIGMVISGLGAIGALVAGVLLTAGGNYFAGLVQAPLSFFMSLALYVVFQRVADMD